jgi:UDP-N-acetylglucosamine--N-acetylmuramyl-(pentapeptide) pyrophosphoryl-undecaprenol N-acetylglucosamine transferase
MTRTVLLAGGGTAGHVSPLLAVADALRRTAPDLEVLVLGTDEGLEARLVPAAGYELLTIPKVPFPRRPDGSALRFPGRFLRTVAAVRTILAEREVAAVAGFGGYVCPPAYLAARRARLPLTVHEANARPGLANRLGARSAAHVLTAFPGSALPRARHVGMPMRTAVSGLDRPTARAAARARLDLDPARPVLLVTGGSLGAQSLNAALAGAAADLVAAGVQVVHVTGTGKSVDLPADLADYRVVEYVDAMEDVYAAADLVVCRAGAGTVSELSAVGLPAVYVPLPVGNGEQALNARPVVDADGALLIDDADFTADTVRSVVLPLVTDPDRLAALSAAAERFGIRDADRTVADAVLQTLPKETA